MRCTSIIVGLFLGIITKDRHGMRRLRHARLVLDKLARRCFERSDIRSLVRVVLDRLGIARVDRRLVPHDRLHLSTNVNRYAFAECRRQ